MGIADHVYPLLMVVKNVDNVHIMRVLRVACGLGLKQNFVSLPKGPNKWMLWQASDIAST